MTESSIEIEVRERVEAVCARLSAAAARAGREAADVTLVGVCKRQPVARVAAAVRAGVLHLGENYVQEAAEKRAGLERELAADPVPHSIARPQWHLIGRLQRNKARAAVELFDAIETLDRAALARELDRRAEALGRRLDVYLQVNLSGEAHKGGIAAEGAATLLEYCAGLESLRVVGLMTIPAAHPDPEAARAVYARLRGLRDELRSATGGESLRELSMGMSGDFEVAVEEGATVVRVGTALFGERKEAA